MSNRNEWIKESNNNKKCTEKKIILFHCGRWWIIMFRISNNSVIHYVMREFMFSHAWDFKISDVKSIPLTMSTKFREEENQRKRDTNIRKKKPKTDDEPK